MQVTDSPSGARITVRVRPRARPGIELADGTIVVRVAAPPAEGRANDEARRTLAGCLRVPPSRVALHRGARSPAKVFEVEGMSAAEATARLRAELSR